MAGVGGELDPDEPRPALQPRLPGVDAAVVCAALPGRGEVPLRLGTPEPLAPAGAGALPPAPGPRVLRHPARPGNVEQPLQSLRPAVLLVLQTHQLLLGSWNLLSHLLALGTRPIASHHAVTVWERGKAGFLL